MHSVDPYMSNEGRNDGINGVKSRDAGAEPWSTSRPDFAELAEGGVYFALRSVPPAPKRN